MSITIEEKTTVSQSILDPKVKIVIPVCRAFHNMDDFSSFDNKVFEFENDLISGSFTIRHFEKYADDVLNSFFSIRNFINHSMLYGNTIKYQYLEFTFNLTHIDRIKSEEKTGLSEKELESLIQSLVIECCEDEYKMFVFTFFLAFPVSTCFESGEVFVNGKLSSHTDKFINSFDLEVKENIDFQKCWNYLHDKSKFEFGQSKNNASRFISILSKVNESNDIISQIFYATMALESVYARERTESISHQLIDKIKVFLKSEIDKEKLKELYNFRSRYIHGDYDIQLSFLDFEFKKKDKLYELLSFIMEILYMTAKRIIEEKISGVNFDYSYNYSERISY